MLSRFLARTLVGMSLSVFERVALVVVLVIVELLGALFVGAVASTIGGIVSSQETAVTAGLVTVAIYLVGAILVWAMSRPAASSSR